MYPLNLPPLHILQLSSRLMLLGLALLILGLIGAYGLDRHLSMGLLVLAHSMTLIGPALLKIGYVLRLVAQERLQAAPLALA